MWRVGEVVIGANLDMLVEVMGRFGVWDKNKEKDRWQMTDECFLSEETGTRGDIRAEAGVHSAKKITMIRGTG